MPRPVTADIGVVMLTVSVGVHMVRVDVPSPWLVVLTCLVLAIYDRRLVSPPDNRHGSVSAVSGTTPRPLP